jgi:hypothetical protein
VEIYRVGAKAPPGKSAETKDHQGRKCLWCPVAEAPLVNDANPTKPRGKNATREKEFRGKTVEVPTVDGLDLTRKQNSLNRLLWALRIGRRKRQDLGLAPLDYAKSLGGASDG